MKFSHISGPQLALIIIMRLRSQYKENLRYFTYPLLQSSSQKPEYIKYIHLKL